MSASPDGSEGDEASEVGAARRRLTRRDFVKWGVMAGTVAGLSSIGVASALGILKAPKEPTPAWEVAPGVVDYSLVPAGLDGPTPNVLKVAQWFQYWPGKFIDDFIAYMQEVYHVTVDVQVDIFGSNEELFNWITIGRKKYDVFFPSNYVVDLLKNGNMIYNLNTAWLPNFVANVGDDFKSVPRDDPFDRRGPTGDYVSVPYFWGTTGVGFRTDKLPRADVIDQGFDLFWRDSFTPTVSGYPSVNLVKKMRLLEDERDVLGWGLKKAGWEEQIAKGYTPMALPYNPAAPYNGQYQWTTNETEPARVAAAVDWLTRCRPNLFDFNSTDAATSLVSGSAYYNQVWSGDVMYAKRPDQNQTMPVDYILPKQGSTWWIDCAAIHSKSRNLWLAHQFINFIHSVDKPWEENQLLTVWNLYSTPNRVCYEGLQPSPNGWDMKTEPILYPNEFDLPNWVNLDMSGDVGLDVLLNLYNPMWFELTTG